MSEWDSKNSRYVYPSWERVDDAQIKRICNNIKDQAAKLEKVAVDQINTLSNLENVARDIQSDKVLKVNGRLYHQKILDVQAEMLAAAKEIKAAADSIKSAASSRRQTENSQYNTYFWRKQEEARQNSGS